MATGYKSGGREKGVPNRDKKHFLETIQEKYPDFHPVIAMAEIANDLTNDVILRFHACKEIAKYVTPQLKAVQYIVPEHERPKPNFPEWLNRGNTIPITAWIEQESKKSIDLSVYTNEELTALRSLLEKGNVGDKLEFR